MTIITVPKHYDGLPAFYPAVGSDVKLEFLDRDWAKPKILGYEGQTYDLVTLDEIMDFSNTPELPPPEFGPKKLFCPAPGVRVWVGGRPWDSGTAIIATNHGNYISLAPTSINYTQIVSYVFTVITDKKLHLHFEMWLDRLYMHHKLYSGFDSQIEWAGFENEANFGCGALLTQYGAWSYEYPTVPHRYATSVGGSFDQDSGCVIQITGAIADPLYSTTTKIVIDQEMVYSTESDCFGASFRFYWHQYNSPGSPLAKSTCYISRLIATELMP